MDIINKNNIIIIGFTIYKDPISIKRVHNLKKRIEEDKIPLYIFHNVKTRYNLENRLSCIISTNIIKTILMFHKTNFDYCIICENDFYPTNNFLNKLNETVKLLPNNWRSLHLCPGFLWGRGKYNYSNNKNKKINIDKPDPEINLKNFSIDKSNRFIYNLNPKLLLNNNAWLGGPIAILLNKKNHSHIHFLKQYIYLFNKKNDPGDVILSKMITNKDFICYNPQLGKEEECGGTTLPH